MVSWADIDFIYLLETFQVDIFLECKYYSYHSLNIYCGCSAVLTVFFSFVLIYLFNLFIFGCIGPSLLRVGFL